MHQGIANELELRPGQVEQVATLLAAGNTIPFIARYRKEATGNLDEVQLRAIQAKLKQHQELAARKATIEKALRAQGVWQAEHATTLAQLTTLPQVEDFYLPYKQKRRTKATVAKEAGLMPLAQALQRFPPTDLATLAQPYLNPEAGFADVAAVLAGVQDIFAEVIGENAGLRDWVRQQLLTQGQVSAKPKRGLAADADPKGTYALYYGFTRPVKQVANHQILALHRGEQAGILSWGIDLDLDSITRYLHFRVIGRKTGPAATLLSEAAVQAYKRFMAPTLERELKHQLFERASAAAITVFGKNLYHLLMAPPLHGQVVLGFDPGVRTGAKLAVVDAHGKFLDHAVIYPFKSPKYDLAQAKQTVRDLVQKHGVTLVAIGNGTASRESQQFIADLIQSDLPALQYVVVNEAGASVYSASELARAEFPQLAVEQRSAISIARRLQDPMAELVKIDPQAVGVGQYQHDLPEKALQQAVGDVLETAVNQVGIDVNTASVPLLTHIAGLTPTTAQNIVTFREANGPFTTRAALKQVPKLGPKAFEQAAGFLRIPNGSEPLDNTDIHPESYAVARKIQGQPLTPALALQLQVSLEHLQDLNRSLKQPGRDIRGTAPRAMMRQDVLTIQDLQVGMALEGTVRNVVDFGAFVDIGVHIDGLVHISQLQARRVTDPHQVVSVGDIVSVWVTELEPKRERIGLTMRPPEN